MARLIFSDSPTGKAEVASQSKYETPTGLAFKLRIASSYIHNLPDYSNRRIFSMPNKTGLYLEVDGRDTGYFKVKLGDNADDITETDILKSVIPGSGDIIIYAQRVTGSNGRDFVIFDSSGTSLVAATPGSPGGDLSTAASSGLITLHNVGQAASYAGLAIYSAALSSGDRWSVPTTGDANLIGLYFMDDDGTGKAKDAVSGGTSLTLTDGTLDGTADAWDPAGGGGIVARPWIMG